MEMFANEKYYLKVNIGKHIAKFSSAAMEPKKDFLRCVYTHRIFILEWVQ